MRTSMTSQQTAFFTQNGYIELEGLNFGPEKIFSAARAASNNQPFGRDLWRKENALKSLLLLKLNPAIFHLIARPVRLACDQWMPSPLLSQPRLAIGSMTEYSMDRPSPSNDLFSIQGLVLCAIFTAVQIPIPIRRAAAFGIPPFSGNPNSVLFVKPNIILDWPLLAKSPVDLYIAAYALQNNAVYVHNPKDPATHALKGLGYEFGDVLTESHHPLLRSVP